MKGIRVVCNKAGKLDSYCDKCFHYEPHTHKTCICEGINEVKKCYYVKNSKLKAIKVKCKPIKTKPVYKLF